MAGRTFGLVAAVLGATRCGAHLSPGEATCADRDPEVIFVELDEPGALTHAKLAEWSQGFKLPTVVRNAFKNTMGCNFDYLDDSTELKAKFGKLGGFNEKDRESFTWAKVKETLKLRSEKIYGSFGYGTGNTEAIHKAGIHKLKDAIAPEIFLGNGYPGHVIFGSTNETEVSTSWHNAIDANLLFQLCGSKEWYTMEGLPADQYAIQVAPHAHGVVNSKGVVYPNFDMAVTEVFKHNEDWTADMDNAATHFTLYPGDLLINPPFSWHAIKINQTSVSLSLRGDTNDVLVWIAGKYFNGDINNPLLACFATLFNPYYEPFIQNTLDSWLEWAGKKIFAKLMGVTVLDLNYGLYGGKAWTLMRSMRKHFDEYQGTVAPMYNGLVHNFHLYNGGAVTDEDIAKMKEAKAAKIY